MPVHKTASLHEIDVPNMPLNLFLHDSFLEQTATGRDLLQKQAFFKTLKSHCIDVAQSKKLRLSEIRVRELIENDGFRQWLNQDEPVANLVTVLLVTHEVLLP